MATKTYSFNTGSATMAQFDAAIAAFYGYESTIPDPAHEGQTIPNPETVAQFSRRKLLADMQDRFRDGSVSLGVKSTKDNIINNLTTIV